LTSFTKVFAVAALAVDVCMFIFEILLECVDQRLWKACMAIGFEDKEWFVGRTHKSLRGIKESIYTFKIWMYI
jgi:hypothetical protein